MLSVNTHLGSILVKRTYKADGSVSSLVVFAEGRTLHMPSRTFGWSDLSLKDAVSKIIMVLNDRKGMN